MSERSDDDVCGNYKQVFNIAEMLDCAWGTGAQLGGNKVRLFPG